MRVELKVLDKEFYNVEKLGGSYYDIPDYQTPGAAGIDLKATKDYSVYPGKITSIPTGLSIHVGSGIGSNGFFGPHNVMGMIVPRSSWGSKGLTLANTVGIIDEDYQGELILKVFNRYDTDLCIKAGDRIAQLIFVPILQPQFKIVEEFSDETRRGSGGWGSTG